jgi:hypothetical protein
MKTSVTLDERHFKAAALKAKQLRKTPQQYLHSLIDADAMTFDKILAPARASFRRTGGSEDELDRVVTDARKAIFSKTRRGSRK